MKINQASIGPTVQFFKSNFLSRWGFKDYYDQNQPCVFFGAWSQSQIIQNHKSYKIVIATEPSDIPNFDIVTNTKDLFIVNSLNNNIPKDIVCKEVTLEFKDYSLFQPNELGDKIYSYTGFKNGWHDRWNTEKINEIQKHIDYEIIHTNHNDQQDYYDINYLKSNYYDKSFLNLNLSTENGLSTVIELGLMGRKTIMNEQHYKYPSIISYKDDEDLINLIKQESKKINTIQHSIDAHTIGDEWLYTEWWLNN
tara:strand:+ start:84 stop:839 length:756 start_codon:yes stop_codon:yes gene_type:complete